MSSFSIGNSWLPTTCISSEKIDAIRMRDTPPEMTIWERIKEFFCRNQHDKALDLLYKLCHPGPEPSKEKIGRLFSELRELAAPGYKSNFFITENSEEENYRYEIKDKSEKNIFSVFYHSVTVNGPEGSWKHMVYRPRTTHAA